MNGMPIRRKTRDFRQDCLILEYKNKAPAAAATAHAPEGVVTNLTRFGAFVDIGVHQDGLIHISELDNRFVEDPSEVVSVGDVVRVKVLNVDLERRRIGLSRKQGYALSIKQIV